MSNPSTECQTFECSLFDKSFESQFDELFGDLYVSKKRETVKANTFYVLPITLPAGRTYAKPGDCQINYHDRAMIGVRTLLRRHPHVQQQLITSVDTYDAKSNYEGIISEIRDIVTADKLMILVDEYDRAPMEAYVKQLHGNTSEGSSMSDVNDALSNFLYTLKFLGSRFLVTGIFTVPGMDIHVHPRIHTYEKTFSHSQSHICTYTHSHYHAPLRSG